MDLAAVCGGGGGGGSGRSRDFITAVALAGFSGCIGPRGTGGGCSSSVYT